MTSQFHKSTLSTLNQYPLYFANKETDRIAKHLTSFGNTFPERIVYMGPRYTNAAQAFKAFGRSHQECQKKCSQICNCEQSKLYSNKSIHKYTFDEYNHKERFIPQRAQEYRLFKGTNPTASKDELQFDSNFQCGNLDLAVKVSNSEYDLFLRVDSNTKGHACWFFFKVFQLKQTPTVKFNIFNFSKKDLMYDSGLKILIYSSSKQTWLPGGDKIQFKQPSRVRYEDEEQERCTIAKKQAKCLSFQYSFAPTDEQIYFAYCLPYSYSLLLDQLKTLKSLKQNIVEVDYSNKTTGGLNIPILTINNKQTTIATPFNCRKNQIKPICLIIGRIHPGETHSSWILQGLINFLCSPAAEYLRDRIAFKIIPMLNIDGVVLGNFRTGLMGRDLNRIFHDTQISKQISLVRNLAAKFQPFLFMDFHAHCTKKYIFAYGPDYGIEHRYFLQSRMLPKLLEKASQSFRYYSCSFKISQGKLNTARSIMLKNHEVNYSYTIQTSIFGYGPKANQKMFTQWELIKSGEQIGEGLTNFVKIVFTLPKRAQMKQQKIIKTNKDRESKVFVKISTHRQETSEELSKQAEEIIKEIMKDENQLNHQQNKQEEESDCEDGEDYTDLQLVQLFKNTGPQENNIKKIKKRKKHPNLPIKTNKTERSIPQSEDQKPIEKKVEVRKMQPINRQIRLRVSKEMPCVTPFLNRNVLNKTKYSSSFISYQTDSSRIYYKRSSHLLEASSGGTNEQDQTEKVSLIKPPSFIQYHPNIDSSYQPFSSSKNKHKEKQQRLSKKQTKVKLNPEPKVEVQTPVLPLLGRSGIMNAHEARALMEEIIQKHEKLKINKTRRQLNVLPI